MSKPAKVNQESGVIHIPVILLVVAVIAGTTFASTRIKTTKHFSDKASVLSDEDEGDDEDEDSDNSGKSDDDEDKDDENDNDELEDNDKDDEDEEDDKDEGKKEVEFKTTTGTKVKTKSESQKKETEIETLEGTKIKTKVEDDGKTKVEIEQGGFKLKYELKGDKLELKVENEDGEEVELEEEELEELENEVELELESSGVKVTKEFNKPALTAGGVSAITKFPLAVDVATNSLIVTTPAGEKIVTVLPDKAVENLLDTKVISKIDITSAELSEATSSTSSAGKVNVIELEIKNDDLVYKIKGSKVKNLFGIVPVDTDVTAFVSASSGEILAQEQSLFTSFINLLSSQE